MSGEDARHFRRFDVYTEHPFGETCQRDAERRVRSSGDTVQVEEGRIRSDRDTHERRDPPIGSNRVRAAE